MEYDSNNNKSNKKIRIRKNLKGKFNGLRKSEIISFRGDEFILSYLSRVIQKTEFINKAIYFYITYLTDPEKVMKELRFKYPEKYKYVGRKKFKY